MSKVTIATIGSHSALDICRGAKDEGFKTLVVVEKGRDKTYAHYFKSTRLPKSSESLGCVDEVLYVEKFKDILQNQIQRTLKKKNCILVPHRSFEVYIDNYDAIEKTFKIPVFGNKFFLRVEERDSTPNQYDLLKNAQIRIPRVFKNFQEIDRLVIVKVLEKERKFERAFFLASSPLDFKTKSEEFIEAGKITRDSLEKAVIEEFILGVQVNFNFFYSPIHNRLELIGTDTRRQTNIDGFLKLPALYQSTIINPPDPRSLSPNQRLFRVGDPTPGQLSTILKFEEAGHIAVTTLESMLEPAFEIGEKFVKAAKSTFPPGVIGPFSLQSVIIPGPPKKEIVVFDVSPRMPGSPGIFATPYSGYLFGRNISMGRRVAMEIKSAIVKKQISKITT